MVYLTYLKFSAGTSFCDINAAFSCSVVNQSVYSTLLGIPVSILGLIYFAAVGGLVFSGVAGKETYRLIFLATAASLAFSLYLSYAEVFILQTICVLCESSKVLMLLIGVASFSEMRRPRTEHS